MNGVASSTGKGDVMRGTYEIHMCHAHMNCVALMKFICATHHISFFGAAESLTCATQFNSQKRPTKETYKTDLQNRPTKQTYKRDLQKKPANSQFIHISVSRRVCE